MITALVLAVATALATVFAISGVAKLLDPDSTLEAIPQFGLPDRFATAGWVRLLALGEVAVAVGLLAAPGWLFAVAAAGATALSVLFTVLVVRVVAAGESFDCGCFGAAAPSRIGPWTIARNVALTVGSGLVLAVSPTGGGVLERIIGLEDPWAAVILVLVAAAATAAALFIPGARRSSVADASAAAALPDLQPLPEHPAATLDPGVYLFLRGNCGACRRVLTEFNAALADDPDTDLGATAFVQGDLAAVRQQFPALANYLRPMTDPLKEAYGIRVVPSALNILPTGQMQLRSGSGAILALMEG